MNLHLFDVKSIKNVELRRKTFKTTQKYKSDHITMNLHRFDVKSIKTTQNNKIHQITMNLHRFDVKSIQNVELRRNSFKTTQNYKSNQITMTCIDLMSKHSKLQK